MAKEFKHKQIGSRIQRLPICGGNWNNGSNAGVFNVNLNNPRSNANGNIGFRSALLWSDAGLPREPGQYRHVKDPVSALAGASEKQGTCQGAMDAPALSLRHGMPGVGNPKPAMARR